MKYSKSVTLRDGRTCVIRSGEAGDAQGVYESFMLTHGETDYLLS